MPRGWRKREREKERERERERNSTTVKGLKASKLHAAHGHF